MQIIERYLTKNPCYKANVNRVDSRYTTFQDRGPAGGMLHSVGCAQPSAEVFIKNWDNENYTNACVHGFIDANTGVVYQTLPWNYRGWHAGKAVGNNTLLGVEMCESKHIRYTSGASFEVLDLEAARADCKRTYDSAVELFAMLATMYSWNVDNEIMSHKEGGLRNIATKHVDPEHYWSGLGMPYTMDGFRADVKKAMVPEVEPDVLWRVQLGAFRRKDYAEAYLEQVRKTYPNAFLVKGGG